ncbi:MAG: 50S ribosomal protein L23 [bacterium]|nr:50S ribosomal protein L23 [bacterium]
MAAGLSYERVLRRHVLTEKSALASETLNRYTFEVDHRASKEDVKRAVEKIFKVTVEGVRTLKIPGKFKRVGRQMGKTSAWKKAIVQLAEKQKIEFIEGQ